MALRSLTSSIKISRSRSRAYSSAPLKSAVGTLYTACRRVAADAELLARYEQELQLFPAGLSPAALWWTLVQLHMPAQTRVELPEFLLGAKAAAEAQLRAVNSVDFAEFAAGLTHESAAAAELGDYCTPRFFDSLKEAAAHTLQDRNMTLELQSIEIQSAAVASVRYAQLTETEYEAQTAGLAVLPLLWAADASVEYMQIQVSTRSLETTKMTLVGQEECLALQDNTRTWTFGSKVGRVDELDWRIVNTVGANNAAKQLSRTVFGGENDESDKVALERERNGY
ncbi:ATP-binding Cassette (ABC) Superfamily [Phytophthora cinnamomi]|uniref:ATP-binding Cassette (ABC) Superfamily n=1 Tax=Phytophthora cinnamomi TaxID=4785 RepID=UPI00355A2EA7|nr:ATP-binding Cassette (ABC) Superfamily [Phytophthora cinnamomi]